MPLCQVPDYFFVLLNILKVGGRDGCLFTKNTLTNATKFKNMHNFPSWLNNWLTFLSGCTKNIFFFFFLGGGGDSYIKVTGMLVGN